MQTLVTVEEYRTITADTTTAASAVSARLEEALDLVEECLDRRLESGTYTETLEVWYEDGIRYVYPLVTPVTSVPASAAYEVDFGDRRLRGVIANAPSGVTWPVLTPNVHSSSAISPYSRSRPDYATVEYTGGFTHDTLPVTLRQYIAFVARGLVKRNVGMVIGAQEVSVGDVRVKYPAISSALDALVPGVSLGLKPYRRKRIRF